MSKKANAKKVGKEEENQLFTPVEQQALDNINQEKFQTINKNIISSIDGKVNVIYQKFEETRNLQLDINQLQDKFESDIRYNIKKKEKLENELQKQAEYYENLHKQKLEDKQKELDILMAQKDIEMKEIKDKLDKINQEIQPLKPWVEEEEDLDTRIKQLNTDLRQSELNHYDEKQKQDRNFSKLRYKFESISSAKIDDIKKSAQKVAEKKVKDQEQDRKELNLSLRKNLIEKQQEVETLKKERCTLMDNNKSFKINLVINKEGIQEYQVVNQKQVNSIKKLKEEVERLKNYISDEVARFTREIEFQKIQHTQRKEELERDIRYIKDQLRQKTGELRNIKSIASAIIEQKQDIENFFLEALQNVRDEIKKKIIIQKKANNSRLPDLSQQTKSQEMQQQSQTYNQDKVDINELDLEEKEKLLRILFSKMNSGTNPLPWQNTKFETSSIHDDSHILENSNPQYD